MTTNDAPGKRDERVDRRVEERGGRRRPCSSRTRCRWHEALAACVAVNGMAPFGLAVGHLLDAMLAAFYVASPRTTWVLRHVPPDVWFEVREERRAKSSCR